MTKQPKDAEEHLAEISKALDASITSLAAIVIHQCSGAAQLDAGFRGTLKKRLFELLEIRDTTFTSE